MAIDQVTNLQTLRGIKIPKQGSFNGVRFVQGHTTAGDPGSGTFEWVADPAGAPSDNDGTVITPAKYEDDTQYDGPGRWIRQVDVRGPCHAEWFGAKGDGTTNDLATIQACLNECGRVDLLAKTYVIDTNRIRFRSNDLVQGQGIDKTIIVAKWDPPTGANRQAFYNYSAPNPPDHPYDYDPTENAVIRDLTVDCWFNSSSRKSTRTAVSLYGANNLVERIKVINFGVGNDGSSGECFPIILSTGTKDYTGVRNNALLGTIRHCEVTEPGTHSTDPGALAEITTLTVTGGGRIYESGQYRPVIGVGGAIIGNRVHDIPYDTTTEGAYQPSAPHAITVAATRGAEVSDNEVVNCDGVGVYVVSWTDEDVVIRNNRLLGVNSGVHIGVSSGELATLEPKHTGTLITGNVIQLCKNTHLVPGGGLAGVRLTLDTGVPNVPPGVIRLSDIRVVGNFIRGQMINDQGGLGTVYPYGVELWLHAKAFENIHVENNTLEIPDAPSEGNTDFHVPYENALVFNPWYRYVGDVPAQQTISLYNNRNLHGDGLRLKAFQYSGGGVTARKGWCTFSTRLQRFLVPMYCGAARVHYDDFAGQLPRSLLGWVAVTSNGGSISARTASGSDVGPGIVSLNTGTGTGTAVLRLGEGAVTVGELPLRIEFNARVGNYIGVESRDYESICGLHNDAGTEAIRFRLSYATGMVFRGETLRDGSVTKYLGSSFNGVGWTRLRLEVIPNPTPDIDLEVRFFLDEQYLFSAVDDEVPNGPLAPYASVRQLAGAMDRSFLVDSFQLQVG